LKRREFITAAVGAAVAATLPTVAPDSYWCSCGQVQYFRQPEGHFAAKYFAGRRFTYALFRMHEHLHRAMRISPEAEQAYLKRILEAEV
jgi:hypothetical protein